MTDMEDRFRSLDRVQMPELWGEATLRAVAEPQVAPQRTNYVLPVGLAIAIVIALIVGLGMLWGPTIGTPAPSPSPALLARGTFVIRDWGPVEFEATREGSSVTGRMEIGMGRGSEWPITVDLQCTRTTEDGLIMIGGYTDGGLHPDGTFAAIALRRAPVKAAIWAYGSPPWTPTTDCLANLDGWLTEERTNHPTDEIWLRDDIEGTVEFGP